MLNTLSNFYSLVGRDEEYEENYQKLLQSYRKKDFNSQEFLFGFIRVQYNYAHHLLAKDRSLEAMQIAIETIEVCKTYETSYQLAPLLILVGNASREFLGNEKAMTYYLEARDLSKIYGHTSLYLQIEKYLNDLNTEHSST